MSSTQSVETSVGLVGSGCKLQCSDGRYVSKCGAECVFGKKAKCVRSRFNELSVGDFSSDNAFPPVLETNEWKSDYQVRLPPKIKARPMGSGKTNGCVRHDPSCTCIAQRTTPGYSRESVNGKMLLCYIERGLPDSSLLMRGAHSTSSTSHYSDGLQSKWQHS
jgi:hypothetical protein